MNLAYLLRAWLNQQAEARLRESLAQAARNAAASPEAPNSKQDSEASTNERGVRDDAGHADLGPRCCDVGIVFALAIEMGGLEDLLDGVVTTHARGCLLRHGGYKGRSIVLVRSGAGRDAAARATQALIAGHRPRWVISAGFAGGLHAGVRRGDIVMADRIVDSSRKSLAIDLKVDPQSLEHATGLHVGRILTADTIVSRSAEKRALGAAHGALAVDMESWAVGEVCRRDKVRFLAVRVISDAVEDELPAELANMLKQTSRAGLAGAVAGALWRRPASAKDMWQLKRDALVNSDRLARFLAGVIERLTRQQG